VRAADIAMAIQRDANEVIDGYMGVLILLSYGEKIILMLLFKLLNPIIFGKRFDIVAIVPFCVFPIVFAIFLPMREKAIHDSLHKESREQIDMIDKVTNTATNYNMVIDFERRNFAAEMIENALTEYHRALRVSRQVLLNTTYFSRWVTAVIIACYIVIGGMQVVGGELSFGTFVIDLKIFDAAGEAFSQMFAQFVGIQSQLPAMMRLYRLLNLPTDVRDRMAVKRATRQLAAQQRKSILLNNPGIVAVDVIPIVVDLPKNFTFEGLPVNFKEALNLSGRHEIQQGEFVAYIGGFSSGKRTLLQLIAGRQLCTGTDILAGGGVFVPAHLRVITISENSLFYSGTLYENLIFGMNKESKGASKKRVVAICSELGIDENVTSAYLDIEDDWEAVFSEAQCKLFNIARGLINNAEVICLHKPMVKLNPGQPLVLLRALRDHVDNRGLLFDTDPSMRRPRTIICSSANAEAVRQADTVYHLDRENGIRVVSHEEAESIMKV
jgi:ABC-type multidrug transport system fused ATPase/permease subunit